MTQQPKRTTAQSTQDPLGLIMADIHKADWSPDAAFRSGQTTVHYVTLEKMKRIIAPILDRHGAYLHLDMREAVPQTEQIMRVVADISLRRTADNKPLAESHIIADGVSPIKGTIYAVSAALRTFFLSTFLLSDGMEVIEPDSDPVTIEEIRRPEAAVPVIERAPPATPITPAPVPADGGTIPAVVLTAVTRALRNVTASEVSDDIKEEARQRRVAIRSLDDATAFIAWAKEVIQ